MTQFKSDLLRLLDERGYIHQLTDAEGLDELAIKEIVPGYIGFDATAPSLHVGSLVQIMLLRRLQQAGHKPIVVMGGGTTKIGDPTGRDESRKLLDDATIDFNIASIRTIFERFLSFDSVRIRLEREQPMTFLEFNYMIMQGYDFLELWRRHGCRLQMGGSDQWGNIVNGVELTRRVEGEHLYGLTTPLMTTSDGRKMGKTAEGAVWLNADLLSPYDYWQFWRNSQDEDVGRFLRRFTDLPIDEIGRLEGLRGAEINDAKKILADAATAMAHGDEAAIEAAETARRTFEQGSTGEALPTLKVAGSTTLVDALVGLGLVASKNEARRLIAQGGARIDGEAMNEDVPIAVSCDVRVSAGKKKHGLLSPA